LLINAVSNWNGINPTFTNNVDVSLSHTSNFNSATLRFEIVEYVDSGWDGACALFDSNNNNFSPYSTPGDWS
jgi:hypothetical protein